MTKRIPQRSLTEQEKNPLLVLRCLILSGYSSHEIKKRMNLTSRTLRIVAEQQGLKEKLYENTYA